MTRYSRMASALTLLTSLTMSATALPNLAGAQTPPQSVSTQATTPIFSLKDINPGATSSEPTEIRNANGTLFFKADDGSHGVELWKSDGTPNGTTLVKDINPGPASSSIHTITPLNNLVFFLADNGVDGELLWKSDGTPDGTVVVNYTWSGNTGSSPYGLVNNNGTLFFMAGNRQLWKSDGTAAGTVLVKDLQQAAGIPGDIAENLTAANGRIFLRYGNRWDGYQVWTSDGTSGGTVLLKAGFYDDAPVQFTGATGKLFFMYRDELWKTDGTPSGTSLVKAFAPDPDIFVAARGFKAMGGLVFFNAYAEGYGRELWKSDGTPAGTTIVADIQAGTQSSSPSQLTAVNGTLFFGATRGGWYSFWKSDGTAAGTTNVHEIVEPFYLTNVSGLLVFSGYKYGFGEELWKSDGTQAGTSMVQDLQIGMGGAEPNSFYRIGNNVLFTADDGVSGRELWAVPFSALTESSTTITSSGGSFVNYDGSLRLQFPSGAVSADTTVRYRELSSSMQAMVVQSKLLRRFVVEAQMADGTPVTTVAKPYTVELTYDEATVTAAGVAETSLNPAYWNGTTWVNLLPCPGCSVDTVNNRVTATADRFTEFALVGPVSQQQYTVFLPMSTR